MNNTPNNSATTHTVPQTHKSVIKPTEKYPEVYKVVLELENQLPRNSLEARIPFHAPTTVIVTPKSKAAQLLLQEATRSGRYDLTHLNPATKPTKHVVLRYHTQLPTTRLTQLPNVHEARRCIKDEGRGGKRIR